MSCRQIGLRAECHDRYICASYMRRKNQFQTGFDFFDFSLLLLIYHRAESPEGEFCPYARTHIIPAFVCVYCVFILSARIVYIVRVEERERERVQFDDYTIYIQRWQVMPVASRKSITNSEVYACASILLI